MNSGGKNGKTEIAPTSYAEKLSCNLRIALQESSAMKAVEADSITLRIY